MVSMVRAWTNELSIHSKVQLFMATATIMLALLFILQPQIKSLQPPTILITPENIVLASPVIKQKAYPMTPITSEDYSGTKRQEIGNAVSPIAAKIGASTTPIKTASDSPIASTDLALTTTLIGLDAKIGLSITPTSDQKNNCSDLLILEVCLK